MKFMLMVLLAMGISATAIAQENGLNAKESKYSSQETQLRLETALKEKGLTLFAKIDHADGAQKAGLQMPYSTLTIFGNPKGGTPFMLASPAAAIDFPLKGLVWEDSDGKVFYSYNSLSYVVGRHGIKGQDELARKLDGVQAAIAKAATE